MDLKSQNKSFGGEQRVYAHASRALSCDMKFAAFIPPNALSGVGGKKAPALLWQLPARLGIGADQLRPIDRIERWRMPALVVSGQEDRHTTAAETRRLHERANEPKELWLVPGAGHVDLARFAGPDYAERVYGFLHTHLRRPSTVDSAIGL